MLVRIDGFEDCRSLGRDGIREAAAFLRFLELVVISTMYSDFLVEVSSMGAVSSLLSICDTVSDIYTIEFWGSSANVALYVQCDILLSP